MKALIDLAKKIVEEHSPLPYSVVSSLKEQRISNAPVIKPLLIFVLAGVKQLGKDGNIVCPSGTFLFLSSAPDIDMRNVPDGEYCALLVEFDHSDFDQFRCWSSGGRPVHFQGAVDGILEKALQQFIEFPAYAPPALWSARKQELLRLLYLLGHEQVGAIVERPGVSHRLHDMVIEDVQASWTMRRFASRMAISEPTLRRKLKAEGIGIKTIVSRAKLGFGLHLVQTTLEPIGRIAERCGYASQSRFTDRFKALFGVTPTDLRKTRFQD